MKRNLFGFGKRETFHSRIVRAPAKPKPVSTYLGTRIYRSDEGYSTSIDRDSVHDSLADAKAFIKSWKQNPAKFERCVKDVKRSLKKSGRSGSAYAICRATQKNPRERVRFNILPLDIWTVSMLPGVLGGVEKQREKIERGLRRKAKPRKNASIRDLKKQLIHDKVSLGLRRQVVRTAKGYARSRKLVKKESGYRRNPGNPVASAQDRYEGFHGRPSEELLKIRTPIHQHDVLAGIGDLRKLVILTPDKKYRVTVKFSKPYPILAMNEAATQLYIEGGDQSVNLKDFGISEPHEEEVLGHLKGIYYFTTKDHLGSEGGTAVYRHKFGSKHHVFGKKRTPLPTMIYDVRNKLIRFAGGGYSIPDEGIDG